METIYKEKHLLETVKDLDKKKGIVVIGINAFDVMDSDNDVSLQGSFNRTVKNNIKRQKHYIQHERTPLAVGLPLEYIISKKDIAVASLLNQKLSRAVDLLASYEFFAENGRSLEHSIGAKAVDYSFNDEGGINVKEWMLLEYSTVGHGANEFTPLYEIKNEMDIQKALSIVEKLSKMPYSDETKQTIEKFFNAIIQFQKDGSQIFGGSQTAPDEKALEIEKQKQILKLLRTINI